MSKSNRILLLVGLAGTALLVGGVVVAAGAAAFYFRARDAGAGRMASVAGERAIAGPVRDFNDVGEAEVSGAYFDNAAAAKAKYTGTRWKVRARIKAIDESGQISLDFGETADPRPIRLTLKSGEITKVKTGGSYQFEATLEEFRAIDWVRSDYGIIRFGSGSVIGPAEPIRQKDLSDIVNEGLKRPK